MGISLYLSFFHSTNVGLLHSKYSQIFVEEKEEERKERKRKEGGEEKKRGREDHRK